MKYLKNALQHLPGFRSGKTWKKVLVSIFYIFLFICIIPIVLQGSLQDSIVNLAMLMALAALIGALIALIKGRLVVFHITNRKMAMLVLIASLVVISVLPLPEGDEQADSSSNDQVHIVEKDKTDKESEDKQEKAAQRAKEQESNKNDKEQDPEKRDVHEEKQQEDAETSIEKPKSSRQSHGVPATVTRVVDGDTLKISIDGHTDRVRMLLVDTPETKHPTKPVQPFGTEASAFAKQVLSGKQIELEYDGPKRDKYDRLLAYVWVNGKMFNQMLLEEGLARLAYVYDPPYTHYREYMKAQNRAKSARKGIWSRAGYVRDSGFYYKENSSSQENQTSNDSGNLKYDPNGPDRDCGDFNTHKQAQAFYEAAGGPSKDPHRLDGSDGDGKVCEALP